MPTPNQGETRSAFISRAIRFLMAEGKDQKAAVGEAEGIARQHFGKMLFAKCLCIVCKDATSQSTHVPTALGNVTTQSQRRRRREFKEVEAELTQQMSSEGYQTNDDENEASTGGEMDVDKAWSLPLTVVKADADQRLIFGWASVVEKNGVPVIDKQGDIIPVHELEKASYEYVLNSRNGSDMHRRHHLSRLVASLVTTPDIQKAFGFQTDQVGWIVGFYVDDDELWAAHKRGDRPEFSIGGAAIPVEVDLLEPTTKRSVGRLARFPFDEAAAAALYHHFRKLFARQRQVVLHHYGSGNITDPPVSQNFMNVLAHSLRPAFYNSAKDALSKFELPIRKRKSSWASLSSADPPRYDDMMMRSHTKAVDYAADHGADLIDGISNTTRDVLREEIRDAVALHWDVDKLADRLADTGIFSDERAEKIARTEISRAQNAGMLEAGRQFMAGTGSRVRKAWVLGPNPCPVCQALSDAYSVAGQLLDLDEDFGDSGEVPPVHPNCFCEIMLVYGEVNAEAEGGLHGPKWKNTNWQQIATAARKRVLDEHPRYNANSVKLRRNLNAAMREAENYVDNMKDWYSVHRPLAKSIFGDDEPIFEKFLAAASAGLTGEPNVMEAIRAYDHWKTGGLFDDKSYHPAGLYAQSTLSNYIKIQNNEDLSGHKVPHFFANLTGDLSQVTGDRHMARLLFDKDEVSTLTDSQEAVMQEVVAAMAKELDLKPAELQASLWAVDFAHGTGRQNKTTWNYEEILRNKEGALRALVAAERPAQAYEFVSPNIASMTFDEAKDGVGDKRMKTLLQASDDIDQKLGIKAQTHPVIGAWADGAEPSTMKITNETDWEKLKFSASMKGWLSDQKSVLIFKDEYNGPDVLASFHAKGKLDDIHEQLSKDGIEFHTLVPAPDGAKVYVAMTDPATVDQTVAAIKKAATRYETNIEYRDGKAEFVGNLSDQGTDREQRDRAREIYEGNIQRSKVPESGSIWQSVHDRWSEALSYATDEPARPPNFHRPRGAEIVTEYGKPFDVQVNPTKQDLEGMAKDGPVRILIDADQNLYAWDANKAIHASISHALDLDEKHQDTWVWHQNRLLSQRYLEGEPTAVGRGSADVKAAAAEVVERLREVQTGKQRLAKQAIRLIWVANA